MHVSKEREENLIKITKVSEKVNITNNKYNKSKSTLCKPFHIHSKINIDLNSLVCLH